MHAPHPCTLSLWAFQKVNLLGVVYTLALQDGWTPLHYACRHDRLDVANELVLRGADVNAKNKVCHCVVFSHCICTMS